MKRLISVILAISFLILLVSGCDRVDQADRSHYFNGFTTPLQRVTKHFLLYSEKNDKDCLKDLSDSLESNFDRITTDLDYKIDYKIKVIVYSDIKTFHKAVALMHTDDDVIGWSTAKEIKLVSPKNPGSKYSYEDVITVAQHEFTHSVLYNIAGDAPAWLVEGTAMLEANQADKKMIGEMVANSKTKGINELDSFDFYLQSYDYHTDDSTYYYACSLVKYIEDNYGRDKLNLLIRNPSDIKSLLGVDKEELLTNWSDYLKKEYL